MHQGDEGMKEPWGEDDRRRSRVRPRWIISGIVVVLLAIVAVQNSERVDVDLLFFDRQVRVIVLILVSAALGFLAGWLLARPSRAERRQLRRH